MNPDFKAQHYYPADSFFKRDVITLGEDIEFMGVRCIAGETYDGNSVPWLLRLVVPQFGKLSKPAFFHDKAIKIMPWKEAADVYRQAGFAVGANKNRVRVAYFFILLWGVIRKIKQKTNRLINRLRAVFL